MDRFEAMAAVVAVAEAGSLSEAARRRRIPLATVSRKVSELESYLEIKLFNRTNRALALTDAGRSYVAAAKRILGDVAEAERAASGEYTTPRGELRISAPVAFGRLVLLPVVEEFLKAFPEVNINFGLQDRTVNLLEDHIDVALRISHLADSSLVAVRVGEVHRVVCASPDYLKRRGTPLTPEDLGAHDCITYVPLMNPTSWIFRREQVEYAVPVLSRLLVSNLDSARDAACAGLGIAMVFSDIDASAIKAGTLIRLLEEYQSKPIPVSFVYSPNRFMPTKLRAFLDFALPRLKDSLAKGSPRPSRRPHR